MAPALLFAHLLALGVAHGEPFAARIEFGLGENPPERWRGTIRADGAKITSLSGWLFTVEDRIELNAFDIRTRQSARSETSPKGLALRGTTVPGGRVEVSTDRGAFHFRLDQPTGGRDSEFLGGTVRVSVMPTAERLTDDSRYDDYPSVSVGRDGAAWLVWQSYSGGRDESLGRRLATAGRA